MQKLSEQKPGCFALFEGSVQAGLTLRMCRFRESTDSNALLKGEAIINMYPPGRMIYLRRIKYAEINRFYFDGVYIEPWEIIDEGVLISKHMYTASSPMSAAAYPSDLLYAKPFSIKRPCKMQINISLPRVLDGRAAERSLQVAD